MQKKTTRYRRARQLVLGLAAIMVAVCAAMVGGALYSDIVISRDLNHAIATVTHVSPSRTTITYWDAAGEFQQPTRGVLYPGGLEAGQQVRVEYSASHPDLVRIAGRTWTLSLLPAGSTLVVTLLAAALAARAITWWERR